MPLRLESRVVRWPPYFWCAATSCPPPWSNNRPPWHCLEGRLFDYERLDKSDVIVLYSGYEISGQKNRKGYLLPVNADPNRVELNGYPLEVLLANLAKVPARTMTVYLDACFSGESENATLVRSTSEIIIQANLPCSARRMKVVEAAQGD